jgi:hypothetical protein
MTTHPDINDDDPTNHDYSIDLDLDDTDLELSMLHDPTLSDNDTDSLIDSWDHDDLD